MSGNSTNKTATAKTRLAGVALCASLILILSGMAVSQNTAQGPSVITPSCQPQRSHEAEDLALQRERLELDRQKFAGESAAEKQKLQIDQAKLDQEKTNAHLTAIVSLLPLLAAIGTLVYSIWSFRQQIAQQSRLQNEAAQLQFQIKAAEIAFAGAKTPEAVQNRSQALKALFGDRLPPNFAHGFDPLTAGGGKEVPEAKQFFLELLLKYPQRAVEITNLWFALFEEDWVERVRPLLPLIKDKVSFE